MKSSGLRLFLAFLSISILVLAQGILAHYNTSMVFEIEEKTNSSSRKLSNFRQDYSAVRFTVFEILATYDPKLMDNLSSHYKKLMLRLSANAELLGVDTRLISDIDETYAKIINYHYSFADKLAKNLLNSTSRQQYGILDKYCENKERQDAKETEQKIEDIKENNAVNTLILTVGSLGVAVFWALVLMSSLIDRKKHEKAINRSEADLKKAQAMAQMGNWHWDYGKDTFSWSEEMFALYRVENQEVNQDFIRSKIIEEDYHIFIKALEEMENSGKMDITFRIKWPNGSIRYHHIEGDLIRNDQGISEGIFGIEQDVTEDVIKTRSLHQLRNYLKSIVDSMPSILIGVDNYLKVTLLNKEAEGLSSMSMHAAKGKDAFQVFPFLAAHSTIIKNVISHNLPRKEKKVTMILFGEKRFVDMTIFPLVDQSIEGAVIRLDDITELVVLEDRMVQTEKMLSIGGLAAGMAHEINNPLAGILQNLQLLQNRVAPGFDKNMSVAAELDFDLEKMDRYFEERGLKEMIDSAMESGKRASSIVNNMLSFARKNTAIGRKNDLCQLMDDTLELVRNDYNLKKNYDFRKIKITRKYTSPVHKVFCEGPQIQQVFLNLLKNGAEAMSSGRNGGEPSPHFIISIFNDGDKVTVEIRDNGPGMAEEVCKRIFEPFFTTKDVGKGTGLGLSVSYFIITENHEGTMAVDSTIGEGTKFTISLPGTIS